MKIARFLKGFFIGVISEFLDFLFYFMSIVIVKSVIVLFQCVLFQNIFFKTWETPALVRKLRNLCGQWGKQNQTENQMKNENQNEQMKITKNIELNPIW